MQPLVPPPESSDEGYRKVAAWFLGTKGENEQVMLTQIEKTLRRHCQWRREYYPQDAAYITDKVKSSPQYLGQIEKLEKGPLRKKRLFVFLLLLLLLFALYIFMGG